MGPQFLASVVYSFLVLLGPLLPCLAQPQSPRHGCPAGYMPVFGNDHDASWISTQEPPTTSTPSYQLKLFDLLSKVVHSASGASNIHLESTGNHVSTPGLGNHQHHQSNTPVQSSFYLGSEDNQQAFQNAFPAPGHSVLPKGSIFQGCQDPNVPFQVWQTTPKPAGTSFRDTIVKAFANIELKKKQQQADRLLTQQPEPLC